MKAAASLQHLATSLLSFPLLSITGLALALFAQSLMEPVARPAPAIVFYIAASGFVLWAVLRGEWGLASLPEGTVDAETRRPRLIPLLVSLPLLSGAYYYFSGNHFTALNLALWLPGIALFTLALWVPELRSSSGRADWEWLGMLTAALMLAAFFRFYRLGEVPAEPFSDHAEKILDVAGLARGGTSIFFERNTGREAIQMYWTFLIAKAFGTGFSFISLKLGTALIGFFTLPFIYLLGKEFGNPLVGFFALFMFGIAYWPNVTSRIGLRFPLYPLFAASTLLYLARGLRTRSQNDFILCGLFLGLGLHGYSPFRIMPFIVLTAFALFALHEKSREARFHAIRGLAGVTVVSLVVFLPLLRYWLEHPEVFGFRAWSRLGIIGGGISGEAWIVFLSNLLRALLMFNWDDGNIWVNSIPHRPALDVVTGALFVIGIVLLIWRYIRGRDWRDLFLLLSIPLLLMPSILSLAFPLENPALNRASGAAVAAVLVSARALEGLLAGFGGGRRRGVVGYGIAAVLLSASALQNYSLVFKKFDASYRLTVWNSSEMADVIEGPGNTATAWIVPYPQWVDTRLPAMWMGDVEHDFALWPDEFAATRQVGGEKLFIFKPEDSETEKALRQLYPHGMLSRYTSANIGKDFMIFLVKE